MNPIIDVILRNVPAVIALIQARHAAAQPDAPVPTSAEVLAAFEQVFADTILKDQMIRAALATDPGT